MSKTSLSGPEPKSMVSLTLTKAQFYLSLIGHAIAILATALALGAWVGRSFVHGEFDKAMAIFHASAKPAIEQLIDLKIQAHEDRVASEYALVREDMKQRLATIEEHNRLTDERLERIEEKLDRLLERR